MAWSAADVRLPPVFSLFFLNLVKVPLSAGTLPVGLTSATESAVLDGSNPSTAERVAVATGAVIAWRSVSCCPPTSSKTITDVDDVDCSSSSSGGGLGSGRPTWVVFFLRSRRL